MTGSDPLEVLNFTPLTKAAPTLCPKCGALPLIHDPLIWLEHLGIIPERKKDEAA